jgi:hypothetical protein
MSEPQAGSRFFSHVDGFLDGTRYVRLDADGRVFGVAQDGREWEAKSYDASTINDRVASGIWHELTPTEAGS